MIHALETLIAVLQWTRRIPRSFLHARFDTLPSGLPHWRLLWPCPGVVYDSRSQTGALQMVGKLGKLAHLFCIIDERKQKTSLIVKIEIRHSFCWLTCNIFISKPSDDSKKKFWLVDIILNRVVQTRCLLWEFHFLSLQAGVEMYWVVQSGVFLINATQLSIAPVKCQIFYPPQVYQT